MSELAPSTAEALAQLGVDDRTLTIMQALSAAQQQKPAEPDRSAEVDALKAELQRLRDINRALLAHSDFLAAAVGACPECWGEAGPQCAQCGGEGRPGSYLPEPVSFDEIVRPVIRSLRAHLARRRRKTKAKQDAAPAQQEQSGSAA